MTNHCGNNFIQFNIKQFDRIQFNAFRNELVGNELKQWGIKFSPELIRIQGRVLPQEVIMQGGGKTLYINPETASWTQSMRGNSLISCVALRDWVVVHTHQDDKSTTEFLRALKNVSGPMGIQVKDPVRYVVSSSVAIQI